MKKCKKAYQVTVYKFNEETCEYEYKAPIFTNINKAKRFYDCEAGKDTTISIEWDELD